MDDHARTLVYSISRKSGKESVVTEHAATQLPDRHGWWVLRTAVLTRSLTQLKGILFVALLLLLTSCGPFQQVGTIPRGTPDTGNGTPAIIPKSQATPPRAPKAAENVMGATYAFVRNHQLMVALHGQGIRQITYFNFSELPNVFWQTPIWSQNDHFLAVIMNAHKSGLGGGGCPGPDDQEGGLYVLNVETGQVTQITLPQGQIQIQRNAPPQSDSWKYASWEDATHLLAWYNGDGGNTSTAPGLYRYDVKTKTIALVVPLHTIGALSDTDVKKGMPFVLSVRFRSGQLFYEAVTHPYEQQSQISIYAHSVTNPGQQSIKLLDIGSEAWCSMHADSPYVFPAWDVSPDGEQVVAQMLLGSVQVMHIADHSTTGMFNDVPAHVLSHDVQLTWAPDNQAVVLSQSNATQMGDGLYSTSLADPVLTTRYTPLVTGLVTWRSDSAAFVMQSAQDAQPESENGSLPQNVYVFARGDTQGQVLLPNARNFIWG